MTTMTTDQRNLFTALLVCAAAGVALFGYMFGFDLPLAKAAFWSTPKSDMVAMLSGYEALLREPWSLTPAVTTRLLAPNAVSIVFTDSIPWIALLLKASGLGYVLNPLGVFLLLSYALQGTSMVLLLRAMGVRRLAPLIVGGLLALMGPAWIIRQFGHIALSGHFILILALALSVSIARHGLSRKRVGAFVALAAFTTGVHAYHLPPVGACLAAALVSVLLQSGWSALPRVLAAGVAATLGVLIPAFFLSYFTGLASSGGAAALGYFSMNLLGPIEPQASAVFGQKWGGSWFTGAYDPTGGQAFEGFNYAGAGVLAAVIIALALSIDALLRGARPTREQVLRFAPLAAAGLALFVIAVGPTIYMHKQLLLELPKPDGKLAEWLGQFRAHGRFFWTTGYLLLAVGVAQSARLMHGRTFALMGVGLVALQAFDTMPPRQAIREIYSKPDKPPFTPAFAASEAIRNRPWVFVPTYFCVGDGKDLQAMANLALLAVRTGGTANSSATARSTPQDCGFPQDRLKDAPVGDRRITVVFNDGFEEGRRMEAFAGRSDCYRLDRVVVCGRDLQTAAELSPMRGSEMKATKAVFTEIRFDRPTKPPALSSGWSKAEPGGKGVWSEGHVSWLHLDTPAQMPRDGVLFVEIALLGFSDAPLRPQPVTVTLNGKVVKKLSVEPGTFAPYRLRIPATQFEPGKPIDLRLDVPEARAPGAGDDRILGVGIQRVTISY